MLWKVYKTSDSQVVSNKPTIPLPEIMFTALKQILEREMSKFRELGCLGRVFNSKLGSFALLHGKHA